MKINISSNIKEVTKGLSALEAKQLPFAIKYTLNSVVSSVVNQTKKEIQTKLDWKKNIPYVTKYKFATTKDLSGEVFLNQKSWGWYTLHQHFNSGDRNSKGLESWLKKNGFLSQNDFLIVPRNGQTKAGVGKSIISDFKKGNFNKFILVNNSKTGKNGIYAKANAKKFEGKWDTKAVVMLFKIIRKPKYKQRIDLELITNEIWQKKGMEFFTKGLDIGLKNAK